jgi:hypothetical protein
MIRLKSDMEKVYTLLEMCQNRDKLKKELLLTDKNVFEHRLILRQWRKQQSREGLGAVPSSPLELALSKKVSLHLILYIYFGNK